MLPCTAGVPFNSTAEQRVVCCCHQYLQLLLNSPLKCQLKHVFMLLGFRHHRRCRDTGYALCWQLRKRALDKRKFRAVLTSSSTMSMLTSSKGSLPRPRPCCPRPGGVSGAFLTVQRRKINPRSVKVHIWSPWRLSNWLTIKDCIQKGQVLCCCSCTLCMGAGGVLHHRSV